MLFHLGLIVLVFLPPTSPFSVESWKKWMIYERPHGNEKETTRTLFLLWKRKGEEN